MALARCKVSQGGDARLPQGGNGLADAANVKRAGKTVPTLIRRARVTVNLLTLKASALRRGWNRKDTR